MAVAEIRPDWTIGTLNLTAGVVEFTTTGSMLQTAAIQPGDELITRSGLVLVIAGITGQNSGTLMEPCPAGAAGNGQPLRVRFQPDGSRYNGAAAELVQLLSSGNVYEFAGLDGSGGGVPVFTGAGTMEVQDHATFGIQDPNGSLAKLAALIFEANKAIVTDGDANPQQINLGTLGRELFALAKGAASQLVQADGEMVDKASLPVSTATQTALNGKANLGENTFTATQRLQFSSPNIDFFSPSGNNGYVIRANVSNDNDFGFVIQRFGSDIVRFGPDIGMAVTGNASVSGALSKGSGTFLIDHPLDPFNKNLRHGFVESTEYVNIYRGMVDLVDGSMTVDIDAAFGMTDGTFEALNADVMVSSLQNQYGPERVWVEAPADSGKFTIICEDPESTATIAWMVTGRRNDAFVRSDLDPNTDSEGRFIPEFEKEDA